MKQLHVKRGQASIHTLTTTGPRTYLCNRLITFLDWSGTEKLTGACLAPAGWVLIG